MVRSAGQPDLVATFEDEDQSGIGGAGSDGLQLLQGGATIQQSRTRFTSALKVQKERSMDSVVKRCLDEAGRAGESFFYAWTVKDKNSPTGESIIEGIGIKGSMILVRNWGNCTVTVDVVSETPSHWTISAGFVDFETGFNIDRLFRQRKGQDGGRYEAERKLDINFQIGQSKAVRNIVVNALPSWIQDQCLETAKEASAGKYRDVGKHIPNFLREFAKLNVTKEQLIIKIGLPLEQWEPRDLVMLAAIGRAIKDRQTTVENEFPRVAANDNTGASGTSGTPAAQPADGATDSSVTTREPVSMETPKEENPTTEAASDPNAPAADAATPDTPAQGTQAPAPAAADPYKKSGAMTADEMAEIARAEAAEAKHDSTRRQSKRTREPGED